MRSERSDNDWERLKNDPDNWIVIPEFGVQPQDVDFIGFSNPIIGPNTKESPFHRAIRVIICGVRGYILKRFKSIAEMNRINDEGKIVIALATIENLNEALQWLKKNNWHYEITNLQISKSLAIGKNTRLNPLYPVNIITANPLISREK